MTTKIALDLQTCLGQRSGVGTYAYELIRRMKAGNGISYFGELFNFLGRNDNRYALTGIEMPVYEHKIIPYSVYRNHWDKLPVRYDHLFPRADVTHFFNYVVPPKIGGRVMCTVFDMTYLRYPETMEEGNLRRISRGIDDSIRRSDLILTISEFSKREIMELLHVPAEKLRVVYCAAPVPAAAAPMDAVRAKFHIDRPYILFVGNTEPRKNLMRLLEAYEILHTENVQLVLTGGSGWRSEEIRQKAEALPGVVITGYVTDAEKSALFENAALFAYPSLYEGFGIPVLEAMRCGTPVVCSDAASIPEAAGDAARYVNALDADDIAAGLRDVLEHPTLAEELRQKGFIQEKKFSWDASAAALQAVYEELR